MSIKYYRIDDLKLCDYNPRKILDRDKLEIKKSLEKFGFVQPLVVNVNEERKNIVVGGNQRLMVAKSMGMSEVPCWEVSLTLEDEKILNLRLNNNLGIFDEELLKELGKEILNESGFDLDFVNELFSSQISDRGEIDFTEELNEENNYVVLFFRNKVDWLNLVNLFQLKKVKALDSRDGYEKVGVGRVIDGVEFINKLKDS